MEIIYIKGKSYEDEKSVTNEDCDLILKTLHDSDSAKDWNPLYRIANRSQAIWHTRDTYYDIKTHIFKQMTEMAIHDVEAFNRDRINDR
jgi:hypothetical protein